MGFNNSLDDYVKKLNTRCKAVEDELNRVEYCIEHGADCNDWEDDFLASVKDWLMRGRELSPLQIEALEKIEFGLDAYWEEYGRY